jgi:hypothetical protein
MASGTSLAPPCCPEPRQAPPTPPLSFGLLPRLGGPRGFLDLGARLFELSGQLGSLHVRGRTLRLHLRELHLEGLHPVAQRVGSGPLVLPALLRPVSASSLPIGPGFCGTPVRIGSIRPLLRPVGTLVLAVECLLEHFDRR